MPGSGDCCLEGFNEIVRRGTSLDVSLSAGGSGFVTASMLVNGGSETRFSSYLARLRRLLGAADTCKQWLPAYLERNG